MRAGDVKVFLTIFVVLCACAVGQQGPQLQSDLARVLSPAVPAEESLADTKAATISARVREVNVLFSATDWRGRFASNLTLSDLNVRDNGRQPQSLTYFLRQSDLPLRVGILIDVSASVGNVFPAQQRAAEIFLRQTLRPSDSASIMTFAGETHIAQDFTGNLQALTDAVSRLQAGEESTAIYDAVQTSSNKLSSAGKEGLSRRVLILITDGQDTSSVVKQEDAIRAALQSNVVIFALNTNDRPEFTDPALRKLTENTGGSVLYAHGKAQLSQAFRKLNEELRSQYLLAYKPLNWQADNSYHHIQLTAKRFGMRIHCRKGYYAKE